MLHLLPDRLAPVEGHDPRVVAEGQFAALVADLHGQFAGGHQHQGLNAGLFAARLELFENGNGEGGRLAGAGLHLAHHVDARQGLGDEAGLDGRRLQILGLAERRPHGLRQLQRVEPAGLVDLRSSNTGFFRLFFRGWFLFGQGSISIL